MRSTALLLLAAACAHGPSWHVSSRRGWSEYRSTHLLVTTDAPEAKAQWLVAKMERLWAMDLIALFGERVEIPGRLRVIAFADESDYRATAGEGTAAYYGPGLYGEPTVVLPMSALDREPETLAHELAHHVSAYAFPSQPTWFAEGLAMFVQTLAAPEPEVIVLTGSHIPLPTRTPSHSAGAIPRGVAGWSA